MELPRSVRTVLSALEASGQEAWCVGGCVRDLLLGRVPEDWDIASTASPGETMAIFGDDAFPTGLKHGTVTVRAGGDSIEVTTYRVDGVYRDHRRPDSVRFTSSLEEDLSRRDLTVNAMAMNLRGALRDPFGGQADLHAKLLRCVGCPDQRLGEDALRILRCLRFSAVLGFSVEPATAESLHQNRELLRQIAAERIQTELWKLLCGQNAADVLRNYPDVLGVFWPEVLAMVGFQQKNEHHCYDVWEHSLHAMEAVPPVIDLRCVALLHDVGKPMCFTEDAQGVGHFYGHAACSRDLVDAMLRRLKCAGEFRERVVRLVEWHDRPVTQSEKGLRRALRLLGEEDLRRLLCIKRADNLAQSPAYRNRQEELNRGEATLNRLLEEDACFSVRQLAVNGRDLLALGLRGSAVGAVLEELLNRVVEGELPNQREALLQYLRNR